LDLPAGFFTGDLCAVVGLEDFGIGDTISDIDKSFHRLVFTIFINHNIDIGSSDDGPLSWLWNWG
jgi:hypothetical protein